MTILTTELWWGR